mmetsp:Transcript_806/g.1021  ORF Transcript_806/g.1021 Transcript_806/m.1021 type:complete len:200 (-) Transcript_806:211-810(-)
MVLCALLVILGQVSAFFFVPSPLRCVPWPAVMRPFLMLWVGSQMLSLSTQSWWVKCIVEIVAVTSWLLVVSAQALPTTEVSWYMIVAAIGGLAISALAFDWCGVGEPRYRPRDALFEIPQSVSMASKWQHGSACAIFLIALYWTGPRVDEFWLAPVVDLSFTHLLQMVAKRQRGMSGPTRGGQPGPEFSGSPRRAAGTV